MTSQELIDLEKNTAHKITIHYLWYCPKEKGVFVWDLEGNKYYDFLSAYSAVNQGHCHPRIIEALTRQAQNLTLTSRAFYNDQLGHFDAFITQYFGFEKVLPMNTGAEAVETAIKLARKWGYEKRNIPTEKAQIVVCEGNFHGRTTTIISFSDDEGSKKDFGPYTPGFIKIPYDDTKALEAALKSNPNIVGFLVEPIQGEAGIYVPSEGFLSRASALCKAYNVLLMADEVQTGVARTGKRLAIDYENIRPDVLMLGKAISGGVYPVSAVLADNDIMEVFKPGQHGSTFGGNPIAAAVSVEALKVIQDEKLADNAYILGEHFRNKIKEFAKKSEIVKLVRGRGLLNAIVINDTPKSKTAWHICMALKENGLLAKTTHGNIIRFAPPLVITKSEIDNCIEIIQDTLSHF